MSAVIEMHEGSRAELRQLFDLADDSSAQIDAYIGLGRVLVARDVGGEIVGHAQLIATDAHTVELKSIAVREDHQGRGFGRLLVAHALELCRKDGVRVVSVTTATADLDNLRFYQRCGFRAAAIERDAFSEEKGYPPQLEADGIPVRDSITFTLLLDERALSRGKGFAQPQLRPSRETPTQETNQ